MHLPFTENHISYSAQDRVKAILSPLHKMANIHYFNYSLTYPDQTGFTLHTDEHFYEAWYLKQFPFYEFKLPSGWYMCDTIDSSEKIEFSRNLGIANGVMHIDHQPDKTEVIVFATSPENNSILQFYINEMDLLKKFKKYFIEQAKDLVSIANKQLVHTPETMRVDDVLFQQVRMHTRVCESSWNSPFDLLSDRERACCELILKGNSLAATSEQLGLALPTVANYISRAKEKLKFNSRAELFKLAQQWGFVLYS